jgi:hypothetical protein
MPVALSIRRLVLPLAVAATLAACQGPRSAQLRVVGVQKATRDATTVQLQVVNRTKKSMRLQRLEYTFAGAGHQVALGAREIGPGAAAVVEVQLDQPAPTGRLKGKLICDIDQIVQSFPVTADLY